MKSNKLITIISIMLIAVFLASCTKIDTQKQNTFQNVTIPNNASGDVVIPKEDSKEIPSNFSVIEPKVSPGSEKEVKDEGYNLSNSITTKDNCFDSDGGFIFGTKGYIKDTQSKIFKDYCKNNDFVVEYKCGIIGYKEEETSFCTYGCFDGACKAPSEEQLCKDSDGGKIYEKKGTIAYLNQTYTDYCKNANYIKEQYCTNLGVNAEEEKLCDNGCLDGACVVKTIDNQATCKDSDFGSNERYTKGIVTDSKGSVEDSCMNSYTLYEYKCNVVGFRMKQNILCPDTYKCVDGACVEN